MTLGLALNIAGEMVLVYNDHATQDLFNASVSRCHLWDSPWQVIALQQASMTAEEALEQSDTMFGKDKLKEVMLRSLTICECAHACMCEYYRRFFFPCIHSACCCFFFCVRKP